VSGGPVKAEDTAHIVRRMKAKIADDGQNSAVLEDYVYESGEETSEGSLVNLGGISQDEYDYIAPDGPGTRESRS
jgi:hypothetical protein